MQKQNKKGEKLYIRTKNKCRFYMQGLWYEQNEHLTCIINAGKLSLGNLILHYSSINVRLTKCGSGSCCCN